VTRDQPLNDDGAAVKQLGFAFAQGVIAVLRGWFAQNATDFAARFDLTEQNEQNR